MELTLAQRLTLAWVQNCAFDAHSPLDVMAWQKFMLWETSGSDFRLIPGNGAHDLRRELDRRVKNHRALCARTAVS